MSIKKIGVENFRIFKNYTEFEIRPITLLTGPNNSGKSSFTKLLLLLKNGLNKLNFDHGRHNLENYDSIINWESNSNQIKIRLTNNISVLEDDFLTEFIYDGTTPTQVRIKNEEGSLFKAEFKTEKTSNFGMNTTNLFLLTSVNLEILIKVIREKKIRVWHTIEEKNGGYRSSWFPLYSVDRSNDKSRTVNLSNLKEKYYEFYNKNDHGALDLVRNLALHNEIDQLEDTNLLFDLIVDGKNASVYYKEELLNIQEQVFTDYKCQFNLGVDYGPEDIISTLSLSLSRIYKYAERKITEYFSEKIEGKKIRVENSRLGKLIFEEKIFQDDLPENLYYQKSLFEQLQSKTGYEGSFNDLEYISANRGNQRRVLHNSSSSDIDRIILEYSKLQDKNIPFLQEVLEILGIDGDLVVERFQNYISVVYIQKENKKISLSDLGYGYSQILPIIIKIITDMPRGDHEFMGIPIPMLINKTYIIEEPEANLHPNLQSSLADIIVKILEYYPGISFIVETHSEYLIRKLQYLTAKNAINPEESVIYYFNSDKYVNAQEPKVKKIEITGTGNLTDNFGPGFYDEATRLQFELLKINQEQNN